MQLTIKRELTAVALTGIGNSIFFMNRASKEGGLVGRGHAYTISS